jgi:hypothetical protein
MDIYSMTLEIILASLLFITIAYCWRLDGKLKSLRTGNARMVEAAKELQSSVRHAESAVAALRGSAEAAGRELQGKIDEARALAAQPMIRDGIIRDTAPSPVQANVQDFALRRRSVI